MTGWRGPATVVNDRPILLLQGMLHKDYENKCSVGKELLAVSLSELVAHTN
jgi:hypothetical protein